MIFLEQTEENGWNFNLQGADTCYFTPVETGDEIPLQLVTPQMPFLAQDDSDFITTQQSGQISVMLVDANTLDPILEYVDLFCTTYHVGGENQNGIDIQYLTLVVQEQFLPKNIDCFRVTIYTESSEKFWVTEPFKRVICNENTVLLQANYPRFGCDTFLYGKPKGYIGVQTVAYQPYIRLRADWQYTGTATDTTENDNGKVTRQTLHKKYDLRLNELLPPYIADRLHAVVFGNNIQVTADSKRYENLKFDGTFSKNNDQSRMFFPECAFSQRCVIKSINCT